MDKKQRKRLRVLLAGLSDGERTRYTKRAARLRNAALRAQAPGAKPLDVDDFLLALLDPESVADEAESEPPGDDAAVPPGDDAVRGTVIGIVAGACTVQLGDEAVQALLPQDLARRQKSDLAVGDEVLLEKLGDGHRVTAVLPRRSLLSRADPMNPERRRAIAANVDLVVVVVAAESPPLHPRLIDRYLVAVEHSGARPVLVVNKIDLLADDRRHELQARLQPYRALGLPVLPCSVSAGEGIEAIRAVLAGSTCTFVGQSGVGKSSLLNALHAAADARTAEVRPGDGRGRHTTSGSALYELPGGIRVIDTPGIRRFSVEDDDPTALAAGFTEFAPFAGECRYRDCTHTHEPGCAVRRAVAGGTIARDRYQSYLKLLGGDTDAPRRGDEGPPPKG